MRNWRRSQFYEDTGLPWIAPSPNLRSLNAAIVYPGIDILQDADVSTGRGTATPFELFGAPWIHATNCRLYEPPLRPGRSPLYSGDLTPDSALHKGKLWSGRPGGRIDRASVNSMLMGLEIAAALAKLYPDHFHFEKMITLVGNAAVIARLQHGDAPAQIMGEEDPDCGLSWRSAPSICSIAEKLRDITAFTVSVTCPARVLR